MKINRIMESLAIVLFAMGWIVLSTRINEKQTLSKLQIENIEALSSGGEAQVVGCKPMKNATCYIFHGNGQLVDKRKNQYP